MTAPVNFPLVELAVIIQRIESWYVTDAMERTRAISFALLDLLDYAEEHALVDRDLLLPDYLNPILARTYAFLGDPL